MSKTIGEMDEAKPLHASASHIANSTCPTLDELQRFGFEKLREERSVVCTAICEKLSNLVCSNDFSSQSPPIESAANELQPCRSGNYYWLALQEPQEKILCLLCRNHRSRKLRLCVLCKRRRALPSCNPERCWVQGALSCRDCLHHHIEDLFDPLVAARIMQYV